MQSNASDTKNSTISIVIASKGRPEILSETLDSFQCQTLKAEQIIIVVPSAADLPDNRWGDIVHYVVGTEGLTSQRNKGIEVIADSVKYVGCFDDDFELRVDYLEQAVTFMDANVSVVAMSGRLLANRGVNRQEAKRLIANYKPGTNPRGMFFSQGKHHILYGCNMIIRRSILHYEPFDENLPLYSYGEDYDQSIRLERYGYVGKFEGCIGVHLEAQKGRVRELLRGYSAVANNWYFLKKGVMHLPPALAWTRFWVVCVGRSILESLWNLLKGDRSLDWNERLKGHLLALKDLSLGNCHPGRIKEM